MVSDASPSGEGERSSGGECQHTAFVPDGVDITTLELFNPDSCLLCHRDFDDYHHTSYRPERVVPVCETCHNRIHHEDGYHDGLEPDNKRPYEYNSKFKNALRRHTRLEETIKRRCGDGEDHEFIEICVHCDASRSRLEHLGLIGGLKQ